MNWEKIGDFLLSFKKKSIYLGMFILVSIPLIMKMSTRTYITEEVESIYDKVEEVYEYNQENPNDKQAIFVSIDFAPSSKAETSPMLNALLRHAFMRDIPVLGWAGVRTAADYGIERLNSVAKEYGKKYGEDYIYLGIAYPFLQAVLSLNSDVRIFSSTDYYGTDTYEIPIMKQFHSYNNIGLLVSISSTSLSELYIQYSNTLFDQDVAAGVTAVNAARLYPYLQSDQLVGMMGGLKGAAEYEQLVNKLEKKVIGEDVKNYLREFYKKKDPSEYEKKYYEPKFTETQLINKMNSRKLARMGMSSQAVAHFYVIILIIIANVGYFIKRKYE
ncbi:MAG: hypothetical protein FXF47_09145 [Candidatus Mcinerneyibacterium aminivorans]|uniref:Uncharacterized protein n=1 Tax=Candidatus Mcinerneyibacterium aminivorans TaxID=2703815 RepID=A0A5D0M9R6_9BACT|nr:MAG: hypothetical protein FXF47_09145 [Candidatus Mcinerneyibacterium aminivorans]